MVFVLFSDLSHRSLMASFTSLNIPSSRSLDPNLSSPFSLRSPTFSNKSSFSHPIRGFSLRSATFSNRSSFSNPIGGFSLRSSAFSNKSSFSHQIGGRKKVISPCKAMAVVKFKGTQKREKQLSEMIEKKVLEAKEVCEGNKESDECKVAWDEVEEVSQAKADFRRKIEKQDPLESFCQENPETDECRIYED
ncbi:uncharacterized protein LOC143845406 [Tasmannia lanceolata]|uniref:uncharacterized protein LOC143845406 n=1 Tax=Tasmannia lanceolata TaxID=3420 RepID=UPI004062F645